MTLKTYYSSLPEPVAPKTQFIKKMAAMCGVCEQTVRLWVALKTKPENPEHLAILEKETGIAKEELFV